MKTNRKKRSLAENYRLFSVLMLEERIYMDPTISFGTVCGWLGADRHSLGNTIIKELGMSGDSLMKKFRESDMRRIRYKYKLND